MLPADFALMKRRLIWVFGAAIATSQADIPLPPDMIFIGEVGLGGELRGVSQLEKRINEAAKLGFKSAIVPKQSLRGVKNSRRFCGLRD